MTHGETVRVSGRGACPYVGRIDPDRSDVRAPRREGGACCAAGHRASRVFIYVGCIACVKRDPSPCAVREDDEKHARLSPRPARRQYGIPAGIASQ